MFNMFKSKNKKKRIVAPIGGIVHELRKGKDPVFADGLMGPGCFIIPNDEGKIYAPCNGIVSSVFPTKHAYSFESDDGVEIIIHIGIDTVNLNGELFENYVKNDQIIKKGDLIVSFDLDEIQKRNFATDIFIVFPNQTEKEMKIQLGNINIGDTLIDFEK
ncbi:glucose PTS transporter subunit IIA [Enterococcus raffinosus]|uniref:PTS sugar transporter subunit IIA n=1 Tax=Enterococcus raffinosus TaxID=71452 RepID=UPI00288FFD50|nr:glucose PTS transporter subunit IIA [Enterococcus raffinosus]MDT2557075.1 glucose PTS transporter subunit IIA [Enterococcus raffinosus]